MPINRKEINLSYLLDQLVDECYPMLASRNLTCKLEKPNQIIYWGDGDKLARAFDNLLKNAINYSYEGTEIKIVAIEPQSSPVLSGGKSGAHKIQGLGAGFVPKNLDLSVIDEVVKVSDEAAITAAKRLSEEEGLFVGISSGAAYSAATSLLNRDENAGKKIVTLFPDGGAKYLSTL